VEIISSQGELASDMGNMDDTGNVDIQPLPETFAQGDIPPTQIDFPNPATDLATYAIPQVDQQVGQYGAAWQEVQSRNLEKRTESTRTVANLANRVLEENTIGMLGLTQAAMEESRRMSEQMAAVGLAAWAESVPFRASADFQANPAFGDESQEASSAMRSGTARIRQETRDWNQQFSECFCGNETREQRRERLGLSDYQNDY
jgi:hypothetical protein